MAPSRKTGNMLGWTVGIQVFGIVALAIYVDVLVRNLSGVIPVVRLDTGALNIVTAVLGLLGAYSVVSGFLWPRLMEGGRRSSGLWQKMGPEMRSFSVFAIRAASFESVAFYGFMLGLAGAVWIIIAPFLAVAAIALVVTFPTRSRWERMLLAFRDEPG